MMINNRSTDQSYDSVGGAISEGEFGASCRRSSMRNQRRFRTAALGHAPRPARTSIPTAWRSRLQIAPGLPAHSTCGTGYSGLIYVDRDTEMILG